MSRQNKTPIGWKRDEDGNEVPDEDEQELIAIVRDFRAIRYSYSEIAKMLTEAKFTTKSGYIVFTKNTVKRVNDAETPQERKQRLELASELTMNE